MTHRCHELASERGRNQKKNQPSAVGEANPIPRSFALRSWCFDEEKAVLVFSIKPLKEVPCRLASGF